MADDKSKANQPAAGKAAEQSGKFYVDGKAVSEEAYLDAAERAGWDRAFLVAHPERRNPINTTNHGE